MNNDTDTDRTEDLEIRFLLKRGERERDAWRDSDDLNPGKAAIRDLAAREQDMLTAQEKLTMLRPNVRVKVRNTFQFYRDEDVLRARVNEENPKEMRNREA